MSFVVDDYRIAVKFVSTRVRTPIDDAFRRALWKNYESLQKYVANARIFLSPAIMQLLLINHRELFDQSGVIAVTTDVFLDAVGQERKNLSDSTTTASFLRLLGEVYSLFEAKSVLAMQALTEDHPFTGAFCTSFYTTISVPSSPLYKLFLRLNEHKKELMRNENAVTQDAFDRLKANYRTKVVAAMTDVNLMIEAMLKYDMPIESQSSSSSSNDDDDNESTQTESEQSNKSQQQSNLNRGGENNF